MSWEEDLFLLFDDLEHQAESLYATERELEVADRTRAEYQQVTLASRLMASIDLPLVLDVRGVGVVRGLLQRVGSEWCLLAGNAQDWVVRSAAISRVVGASPRSFPEAAWSPVHRLGLGAALRRVAEAGERCVVHLVDGSQYDGRLLRVGRDFVEVEGAEGRHVLVPFTSLAAVQSRE